MECACYFADKVSAIGLTPPGSPLLSVTSSLRHQVKKKADVAEPPEGFNHVGLLVNQPPGTAGLPFNESSEIEFHEPMELMPD